jgi:hypothetical protein
MHYGIAVGELSGIERLLRVPLHLSRSRRATHQRDRLITLGPQGARQR